MKYLFIDTEATGLPIDENRSPMDADNWPRLVSVAYILCDDREILERKYSIIKPNGFIIPAESIKVHGITTEEAVSNGEPVDKVLDELRLVIEQCDYIVGHNVRFDINVLNAEFYRYNLTLPVSLKPYYCTMALSKDFCGLPNNKYPKLEELYAILTGKNISHAHNAMVDAEAAMGCFWILKDSGIIKSQDEEATITVYPTEDNILWAANQLSTEYATKVYAYLTIACNFLYNKSNFLKSEDDYDSFSDRWMDSFFNSKIDDSFLKRFDEKTQKQLEYYSKDLTCTKNPQDNIEWRDSMFHFLQEEIQKGSSYIIWNKYYNMKNIVTRPYLRFRLKEFEKEVGGTELIEEFKLREPEFSHLTLILEDESSWIDIAIEAVKTRIQKINGTENELLSHVEAENYFLSMIDFFNIFRENEQIKRIDEFNRSMEKSLDPTEMKKNLDVIKNYSSPYTASSSGCMLLLSLFMGLGSFLCLIITFLI